MCHDKLKNVNHGVLLDVLVEVSGTQFLFHWIGCKNLAYIWRYTSLYMHYLLRYQGGVKAPPPYIKPEQPNKDRVNKNTECISGARSGQFTSTKGSMISAKIYTFFSDYLSPVFTKFGMKPYSCKILAFYNLRLQIYGLFKFWPRAVFSLTSEL